MDNKISNLRGKWGFFYEYEINNLDKISTIINKKFQTLTYFGFEKSYFLDFMKKNKPSGIDRFVPVGQALNIELSWDGYDLNKILSREVTLNETNCIKQKRNLRKTANQGALHDD